jgi:hypothetical protein
MAIATPGNAAKKQTRIVLAGFPAGNGGAQSDAMIEQINHCHPERPRSGRRDLLMLRSTSEEKQIPHPIKPGFGMTGLGEAGIRSDRTR